jgi:hypothetical protein
MIWAILFALGVPLWLIVVGIGTMVFRNRSIRRRPGNIPVRLRRAGKKRWKRGHAVWVHDVFAFRGSPAAWEEELSWISGVEQRTATKQEQHQLRMVEDVVVATFTSADDGAVFEVATIAANLVALLGPSAPSLDPTPS